MIKVPGTKCSLILVYPLSWGPPKKAILKCSCFRDDRVILVIRFHGRRKSHRSEMGSSGLYIRLRQLPLESPSFVSCYPRARVNKGQVLDLHVVECCRPTAPRSAWRLCRSIITMDGVPYFLRQGLHCGPSAAPRMSGSQVLAGVEKEFQALVLRSLKHVSLDTEDSCQA